MKFKKNLKLVFISGIILTNLLACRKEASNNDPLAAVYVKKTEKGYQLFRNNLPFYIRGGAASPDFLKELKEAGANTARIYDTTDLAGTLKKAEDLGLAVVVDISLPKFHKDPEFYEDPVLFGQMKKRIESTVRKHKDQPALLYWNLGNEIYYPYLYNRTKFYTNYNSLIDLIHEIDPDHPISTTTIGANKLRVLSIINKSPNLDFISFNSFGSISSFQEKLKPISPIWKGPHVITEWGINGPWEADYTSWNVPIERNSTIKAEDIKFRHENYIQPLQEENSLGSFVFYWGKKDESTPTWFSLFGENKLKTQGVFELKKIWTGIDSLYLGPKIKNLLLNGNSAYGNIILSTQSRVEAEVLHPEDSEKSLEYKWELRYESWNNTRTSKEFRKVDFEKKGNKVTFNAPNEEGPFRLFVYVTDGGEYMATANIPFYTLNPRNGE